MPPAMPNTPEMKELRRMVRARRTYEASVIFLLFHLPLQGGGSRAKRGGRGKVPAQASRTTPPRPEGGGSAGQRGAEGASGLRRHRGLPHPGAARRPSPAGEGERKVHAD